MSSAQEFFAGLYGKVAQPILVLDREQNLIYTAPAVEDLLAVLREKQLDVLLTPRLLREGKECLVKMEGKELPLQLDAHFLTLTLLPYLYEKQKYLVVQVLMNPAALNDEQGLLIFRHSYSKMMSYLNEIYAQAQKIGLKNPVGKEIGNSVQRILRMMTHLDHLVDGADRAFYRVPLELNDFTATFVRKYNEAEPLVKLHFIPCEGSVYARVMPENLELVLSALVSNGLRFGKDQVTVCVSQTEDKVRITVSDNGDGVQDPERVFELGYRTLSNKGSMGLGFSLFMAKKLAEEQGAALLYDRRGKETCFHFEAETVEMPAGKLASWKPEDLENSLAQLRIEMSDFVKEMDL